jgi:phosphatidylserine/phosphatidylglycerophosphate/cardiolipin synthase-like enzyme
MAELGEQGDEAPSLPAPSVWRYARAKRAHLVIDAADYFEIAREAMLRARQNIFLIGWDFDTRIRLEGGRRWWHGKRRERYPARLGAFVVWLVRRRRELTVSVLIWNFGALKFLLRGSMLVDIARWRFHRQIAAILDGAHPVGCSHHQKIMAIDDSLAACGGIDMTSERWDTTEHIEHDPRRTRPGGMAYGPWHDVTMLMEGEVASALADLGRERWKIACGRELPRCEPEQASMWPEDLEADFTDVEIGIARTRAAYGRHREVREIEALFVEQIARARRFVYVETQYFASRRVAEAIARRLIEPEPPEFFLINPISANGWLQPIVMDSARVRLLHSVLEHDHAGRFHMFVPYASEGTPIYVHAKLMIVDDEILRVGSANMNNRSMGLDSECDVFLDAARPGNGHIVPGITALRHRLLAEHCGIAPGEIAALIDRHGSIAAAVEAAPRTGRHLDRFVLRPLSEREKALADSGLLDPERPREVFEPMSRRGLFRGGGILRRPD